MTASLTASPEDLRICSLFVTGMARRPAADRSAPEQARTPSGTRRHWAETATWQVGARRVWVAFSGDVTNVEIDRVFDGVTETTVPRPTASTTSQSLPAPMGWAT